MWQVFIIENILFLETLIVSTGLFIFDSNTRCSFACYFATIKIHKVNSFDYHNWLVIIQGTFAQKITKIKVLTFKPRSKFYFLFLTEKYWGKATIFTFFSYFLRCAVVKIMPLSLKAKTLYSFKVSEVSLQEAETLEAHNLHRSQKPSDSGIFLFSLKCL